MEFAKSDTVNFTFLKFKNQVPEFMLEKAGLGITRLKEHNMPAIKIHDMWTFWVRLNLWSIMNR